MKWLETRMQVVQVVDVDDTPRPSWSTSIKETLLFTTPPLQIPLSFFCCPRTVVLQIPAPPHLTFWECRRGVGGVVRCWGCGTDSPSKKWTDIKYRRAPKSKRYLDYTSKILHFECPHLMSSIVSHQEMRKGAKLISPTPSPSGGP